MKRFLCVVLAFVITIGCVPCRAADVSWTDPFGPQAEAQICDTGRGYIAYSFYSSAVYYSADGAAWTDLSDRSWVRDAASYIYLGVGPHGHREFDLLWTGAEYMLRQSLLDDPRANGVLGDSPRNNFVTFLDEDFQVIGEKAFDGPVTAIRCGDGTYYATVGGVEAAFSREDWAGPFTDVAPDAWYAPYVEVCVADGLMKGTSDTTFSPDRELTLAEVLVLTARQAARIDGGSVPQIDDRFFEMAVFADADGQRLGTLLDKRSAPVLSGLQNIWLFSFQEETLAQAAQRPITLTLDTSPLAEYPRSLLNAFGFSDPGVVQGTWTGVWDEDLGCYAVDFGDDIQNAPEFMIGLSNLTAVCAINRSQGLWYHSELAYLLVSDVSLDCLESVAPTDWLEHPRQWLETAATRGDFGALLGQLFPSPVVTQVPEDIREIDDLGVRALILSGVMEGTGAGYALDRTLTRAEAAAMMARVLRPELRVRFAQTDLAGLMDLGETPHGMMISRHLDLGFAVFRTVEGGEEVWTLITKDGRRLTLDGEPQQQRGGLLVLSRDFQYGVLDLNTFKMVLPYGPYTYCEVKEDGLHQDGVHIITNDPSKDYPAYLVWDDLDHPTELSYAAHTARDNYHEGLRLAMDVETFLLGYRDTRYEFVIPPQWAQGRPFRDGYAAVAVKDSEKLLWGVIDSQGTLIIPPRYTYVENCGQGVFYCSTEGARSLVFAGSKELVERPLEAHPSLSFQNGYAVYKLENGAGAYYMDLSGKQVGPVFDWAGPVDADGDALVVLNGSIYRMELTR